jgi:hypothetical protein
MKLHYYNYDLEATFNGMPSLLNLIKTYQLVQICWGGGQTHRQEGEFINIKILLL